MINFGTLILSLSLSLATSSALANSCRQVHMAPKTTQELMTELVNQDLFVINSENLRTKTPQEIQAGNTKLLRDITTMPAKEWYARLLKTSLNKDLEIFVTDAEKLSLYPGKYNRNQLGLNHEHQTDYFKGYFKDMMGSF